MVPSNPALPSWTPNVWLAGSFLIQRVISQGLAMLDDNYQLSTLVFRLDRDWRPGVRGPQDEVWKATETGAGDGQTWIWRRLEHDQRISEQNRNVWSRPSRSTRKAFKRFLSEQRSPSKRSVLAVARWSSCGHLPRPICARWRTSTYPKPRDGTRFSSTHTRKASTLTIFLPRRTSLYRRDLISAALARPFLRTLTYALLLSGHHC
jgi:hypothetical protein